MDASEAYNYNYNYYYSNTTTMDSYYPTPWAEVIAGAIIASLIILGNVVLLLSILLNYWHRASQFNLFVANLSLSHLLVGALLLPLKVDTQLSGRWRHGSALCVTWVVLDYISTSVSLFILLGLALDRFLRVLGRGFAGKASRVACVLFLILPWLVACLLNLPFLLLGQLSLTVGSVEFCVASLPSSHYVVLAIATFVVPGFFVIVLDLGSVLYWICSSDARLRDRDAPDVSKLKWQIIAMTTVSFVTLILQAPQIILMMLDRLVADMSKSYAMLAIANWLFISASAAIPFLWLMYPDVRMAVKDLSDFPAKCHCQLEKHVHSEVTKNL